MRLIASVLISLSCFIGVASADEKLEPLQRTPNERSLIKYDLEVRQAFHEVFSNNVLALMVATPSFEPEYAVGIVRVASGYRVLYLKADANIWYRGDLRTKRCFADLDTSVAKGVIAAWAAAATNVSSNGDVRMGADGVGYQFLVHSSGHEMQAQTWSPDKGTTAAMAVELGDTMASDCWTKVWLGYIPVSWYYDRLLATKAAALSFRLKSVPKGLGRKP